MLLGMIQLPAKYRCRLYRHQRLLRKLEQRIDAEYDVSKKRVLTRLAVEYAISTGHCVWSSPSIERSYCEWSQSFEVPVSDVYEPSSCLLVMSMACKVGGLEQLVYRWVGSDKSRRYSVALTHMSDIREVPKELCNVVSNSGGRVVLYGCDNVETVAKNLRIDASKYEVIILLTYEDDEVPILAFGTDTFKRPVGLYNQCDHHFWLNVSIVDFVADLRTWGQRISLNNRGVRGSMIVPIIADAVDYVPLPRNVVRENLGISQDIKMIVSAARSVKFNAICGIDFMTVAVPLLRSVPNAYLIIIGPTMSEFPNWAKYYREFGDRIQLLGNISHDKLLQYYNAADMVLDSFPLGGLTATTDAIYCGCPVLSTSDSFQYLIDGGGYCSDIAELQFKAKEILSDETVANRNVSLVRKAIADTMSISVFSRQRDQYIAKLAKLTHRVAGFVSTPSNACFEDYCMFTNERYNYRAVMLRAMRETSSVPAVWDVIISVYRLYMFTKRVVRYLCRKCKLSGRWV